MSSRLSEMCTSIITYTFATLFFFVPLVLWTKNSELFEFNKMMLVYMLTLIIAGTWVSKWIIDRKIEIKKTPLDVPILLFFLGQLITTIFSIDRHTSLWGYYSRFHGGLMSTIAYIVLYYAMVTNISQKDDQHTHLTQDNLLSRVNEKLRIYVYSILSSAVLVASYGVLEHFGIDKTLWVQDVQNRVFSTLGQPNWLSAYLLAILPLPIYLTWTKSKNGWLPWITGSIAALFFLVVLYTKSRSGIGALAVVLTLIFFSLIKLTTQKKKILVVFAMLGLVGLLVGTPWTPNPLQLQQRLTDGGPLWPEAEPYLNKIHLPGRQAGLTTQIKPIDLNKLDTQQKYVVEQRAKGLRAGGSDSGEIRAVVWKGAIELFKRYPILGTGVETFGYSYYWARPVAHNMLSEWDFLYNKAHNEYLNFLANTGLVGFCTYAIMLFAMLFLFLHNLRTDSEHRLIHWSFLIGFISILITNYFGFSVVPVALFFFLFPALSYGLTKDASIGGFVTIGTQQTLSKKEQKMLQKGKLQTQVNWIQYSAITIVCVLAIGGIVILSQRWYADTQYAIGRAYNQAGYIGQALKPLNTAHKLYSSEPTFTAELAEADANAALAIQQQYEALPATQAALLKDQVMAQRDEYGRQAIEAINLAISQNPYQLNFLKSQAKVYLTLATFTPSFYPKVVESLFKANALAPTDAKIIYNIGLVYTQMNQTDKAKVAFQKALELKPDYEAAQAQLDLLSKAK